MTLFLWPSSNCAVSPRGDEVFIVPARIGMARPLSLQLYWVLPGSEFSLDFNNAEVPKIVCMGNNPEKAADLRRCPVALCVELVWQMNKKDRLKCSLDEMVSGI